MGKKLIVWALAAIMLFGVFGLAGCDNISLADYKVAGKAAIEAYAQQRKDNYCEDSWSVVCGIVEAGKQAVDAAENKAGVDTAVATAKTAINAVKDDDEDVLQPTKSIQQRMAYERGFTEHSLLP